MEATIQRLLLTGHRKVMEKDEQPLPLVGPRVRLAAAGFGIAWLIITGVLTLTPAPGTRALPWTCLVCGPLGVVDFVLNVGLFVPLGIAWFIATGSARLTVLFGIVVTLSVELLQWKIIPGRDASAGDILSNTIGTALGAWIVPHAGIWARANGPVALRLAKITGFAGAAVAYVATVLVLPIAPTYPQWILVTAERPNLDPFPGTLLSVRVNDRPVRGSDLMTPTAVADLGKSTRFDVVFSGGGFTRRKALILAVANPKEESFFLVQQKDNLIFRPHVFAALLRLRPTLVGLDHAVDLPASPRDTAVTVIVAESDRRGISLSTTRGDRRVVSWVARTTGLAWTFLLPWDVPIDGHWWIANALFLGALVAPASFFAARATGPGLASGIAQREAWWPIGLVLLTLLVAPLIMRIAPLAVVEWLGVATGILVGAWAARLTRKRSRLLKA